MTTDQLKVQRDDLNRQIMAKLIEIAIADTALQSLYKSLDLVNQQLAASEVHDALIVDKTNRKTDAALGTSAR